MRCYQYILSTAVSYWYHWNGIRDFSMRQKPNVSQSWRVFEDSDGRDIIFWEQLDALIPVITLLAGVPSRESRRSLEQWLASRGA